MTNQKTIREILAKRPLVQVDAECPVREAARTMTDANVGAVVVMSGDELLGIFTERDALRIFVATRRNADLTPVRDVMTRKPGTIGPDASVAEAVAMMNKGGYRHLPVVEGGKVLGVVSRRSILMD